MSVIEFNCLPTMIGSMPQKDPTEACAQVLHYLKNMPAWPQLTNRAYVEDMCVQYTEGFPGMVVEEAKMYVDRAKIDQSLEQLYLAFLENDVDKYPISAEYAAGLHKFLNHTDLQVKAVKGQITGPVTLGMTLADKDGRAIAYDEVLSDALAKMLKLKAGWMEKQLSSISKKTIIFVDEPYLVSVGSSFFALSREKVISLLEEVFSGIKGVKGTHCCGNTDWSILMNTSVQVLSFDTYNYAESLALYPKDVKKYIERGGAIAWGIIPNEEKSLAKETISSLLDRLESAIAPFTRKGVELPFRRLIAQGLLTPSCGLARLSSEGAGKCLETLVKLSEKVRSKYS